LKRKEAEAWERAKRLGDEAQVQGREEVERRLEQVGGWEGAVGEWL